MKNKSFFWITILLLFLFFNNAKAYSNRYKYFESIQWDSTSIQSFYKQYPKLAVYKKEVSALYRKHQYIFIWYYNKGRKEIAEVMYDKLNNLKQEGVETTIPYKKELDNLFQKANKKPDVNLELLLTSFYFYYTDKVIEGIDPKKTEELGWFLPRKKMCYLDCLDALLVDPNELDKSDNQFEQYNKLKIVLQRYRNIEAKGEWTEIKFPKNTKAIQPGDTSSIIPEIRRRLFLMNDIVSDSKSNVYDEQLQNGILKYKARNGFLYDKIILPKHIVELNTQISELIKTLIVNMERCRWISADITKAKERILVNIPSYELTYYKNGKEALVSNVVVGNVMNKTVVFSGNLSYIVFSPYWNVPKSILKKEILPGIKKDKNYLSKHHMEWYKGNVRQKPGEENSLGLVKFLFPNTNNIYLHDTPSKSLFNKEDRAFSHGCIRVAKPKELANLILKDNPNWTSEKIEEAMHKGEESWYTLPQKIPVYIGYFTAWVDKDGTVNFYKDVYQKDDALAALLLEE